MATREEVAKRAGVSPSTVTYALTGKRSIKQETRERILQVVAELNYVPHFAAGALAGGRSKTLAMLFPGSAAGISPVALQYITGAVNAASERGYALILWPGDNADMNQIATLGRGFQAIGPLRLRGNGDFYRDPGFWPDLRLEKENARVGLVPLPFPNLKEPYALYRK